MDSAQVLKEWISLKYQGQLIKKTNEPYINHLTAVADMARVAEFGYEIGLCHDLLEDTATTLIELHEALLSFNYDVPSAIFISSCVNELTDVFTKAAWPDLKKSERKEREALRLKGLSPAAQTVKYADLIYNINWMIRYDEKHAAKYLKNKIRLLEILDKGNAVLHERALALAQSALYSLHQ